MLNLLGLNKTSYQLLYQASRDGFDNSIFHSKCDAVLGTLIVIKTKNSNIFGGYTAADWSGYGYKSDSTAFLFSLVNSYNVSVKMNVSEVNNAIFSSPSKSFVFGRDDLSCSNNQCSTISFGNSYKRLSFFPYYSGDSQSFLGGNYNFELVEIEVYRVMKIFH